MPKKIIAMYEMFGKVDGHRCVECCHLKGGDETNVYFKCRLYGDSHSSATDWGKYWIACGAFNVLSLPYCNIYKSLPREAKHDEPIKGQTTIWELSDFIK